MSKFKCTKELYKAFLQARSIRYSGLALSEVSSSEFSHDSTIRWLKNKCFRPPVLLIPAFWHIKLVSDCYGFLPCLNNGVNLTRLGHQTLSKDMVEQGLNGPFSICIDSR